MPHPHWFFHMISPMVVESVFLEPLVFIGVWLLVGWLLVQARSYGSADGLGAVAVGRRTPEERPYRSRRLKFALAALSLYVLYRYWRNR